MCLNRCLNRCLNSCLIRGELIRTCFLKSKELIGFGRAISDGVYQATIYDCAVLPEFHGKGGGTTIMKNILSRISHCNVILYATPGKEGFYQTLGFLRMKTQAWRHKTYNACDT